VASLSAAVRQVELERNEVQSQLHESQALCQALRDKLENIQHDLASQGLQFVCLGMVWWPGVPCMVWWPGDWCALVWCGGPVCLGTVWWPGDWCALVWCGGTRELEFAGLTTNRFTFM